MKYKYRYGYRLETRLYRWLGCYWVAISIYVLDFRVEIVREASVMYVCTYIYVWCVSTNKYCECNPCPNKNRMVCNKWVEHQTSDCDDMRRFEFLKEQTIVADNQHSTLKLSQRCSQNLQKITYTYSTYIHTFKNIHMLLEERNILHL